MSEKKLKERVIKIIHPNYGYPDGKVFDCCSTADKQADSIISLFREYVKGINPPDTLNPWERSDSEIAKEEGFNSAISKVMEGLG